MIRDLRYALRLLLKDRGANAAAVLSLAIGIGATSTAFSWVNGVLLRPFPTVQNGDTPYVLASLSRAGSWGSLSYPDYLDCRFQTAGIADMIATGVEAINLSTTSRSEPAERVHAELVSDNYFQVLNGTAELGRTFLANEYHRAAGHAVAVLSHGFWKRRFGGEVGVLNQTVFLNSRPYTVVGVMSETFRGSVVAFDTNLWLPAAAQPELIGREFLSDRAARWLQVTVRVRPGAGPGEAQARLDAVTRRLATDFPASHQGRSFVLVPLWRAPFGAQATLRTLLLVLGGVAGLVWLLACANVGNVLLIRAVDRGREVAIRLALGATRIQLLRQYLMETILLAGAGALGGLMLTLWARNLLGILYPPTGFPVRFNIQVDRAVLVFTTAIATATGVIFGLMPVFHGLRPALVDVLRDEAGSATARPTRARLREVLVAGQVALCLLILVGGGLFFRSMSRARQIDVGFRPDNVVLARYDLTAHGYSPQTGAAFHERVLRRLEALPGVATASMARLLPLGLQGRNMAAVSVEGYSPGPTEDMQVGANTIGPNYFRVMGIPLARGREFTFFDSTRSEAVVIVNDTMARRYWPGADPVGKLIRVGEERLRVVGVARDVKYETLTEDPSPFLYLSVLQRYRPDMVLHVRTAGNLPAVVAEVRAAITTLDASLLLFDVTTLAAHMRTATAGQQIAAALCLVLALPALTLAAIGIYSLLSYSVRQRTREIGIRVAVGAEPGQVRQMVLRHTLGVAGTGVGLGLVGAVMLAPLLRGLLIGIPALDPLTLAGAVSIIAALAAVSSVVPALRASAIDPAAAIRQM